MMAIFSLAWIVSLLGLHDDQNVQKIDAMDEDDIDMSELVTYSHSSSKS
jgi:hypothetical protein